MVERQKSFLMAGAAEAQFLASLRQRVAWQSEKALRLRGGTAPEPEAVAAPAEDVKNCRRVSAGNASILAS